MSSQKEEKNTFKDENFENQHEEVVTTAQADEENDSINDISAEERQSDQQDEMSDETQKIQAELSEMKDKYLRLYSEFDNYRKRTIKEKAELISNANEGLMQSLLPVIDDFERARKANENQNDIESVKQGFDLIYNKLSSTLTQKGLKAMEIDLGHSFDADLHEAVAQVPAPEENLKGKIIDVLDKGYYLNEKVVRFAKVVIGS
ncbi:MAG: nucleotide exchange factor GrpE [Cyclobacteriaceae bacterium]|nr:nucleotide exchange factor GrpE [Cyclobacteriaceae bacterium]